MIELGLGVNLQNKHKETAVHAACRGGSERVLRVLLAAGGNSEERDGTYGRTPLHWAAFSGSAETIAALLEDHVEVDCKTLTGQTPLYWAVQEGQTGVLELLREAGAKVDRKPKGEGPTILQMASAKGHEPTVEKLLELGADVNLPDRLGRTALHYAAAAGWVHIVRLLLARGAVPDVLAAVGKEKWCASALEFKAVAPLHYAVLFQDKTALEAHSRQRRRQLVEALLEHGADRSLRCGNKSSPAQIAALLGASDILALLAPEVRPPAKRPQSAPARNYAKNGFGGQKPSWAEVQATLNDFLSEALGAQVAVLRDLFVQR